MLIAFLLALACSFGFVAIGVKLGQWDIVDKARHVHAVESFFRRCRAICSERIVEECMASFDAAEALRAGRLARADRVRGLESRRLA
jgi:hypothetical protein